MAPGTDPTETPEDASVVIASFDSRRRAEHLLAALGRGFRKKARAGRVTAVVVSGNSDGSLQLTQSRVVTASGFVATLIRLSLVWLIGLLGFFSSVKGVEGGVHAVKMRQGHVGSDVHRAQQILNEAGPRSALVLVLSKDPDTGHAVVAAAEANASRYWTARSPSCWTHWTPRPPTTGSAPLSVSRQAPMGGPDALTLDVRSSADRTHESRHERTAAAHAVCGKSVR